MSFVAHRPVSLAIPVALVFAVAMSCSQGSRHDESTAEENGAEDLYTLPGLEHGLIQSPVNILTSRAQQGRHEIFFSADGAEARPEAKIEHSVQLDFTPGATISSDGKVYDFLQCHFHTPSEHQVNGVTYPMELHCVNKLQGTQLPPEYLVVAFLFEMGAGNSFVEKFLERLPDSSEEGLLAADRPRQPFSVADLADEVRPEDVYYFYRGSLTTPPYTETVAWHVLSRVFEASPEQIRRINRLEGNNARRIHMLNDRVVGVAP